MNINSIVEELRAERDRIERAIAAIESLNSTGRRKGGRPRNAVTTQRRRRRISAAARAKLSRLLKQRWAQGKMKPRAKAEPSKPARRVSRAARKRIAAEQRARWAKARAQK